MARARRLYLSVTGWCWCLRTTSSKPQPRDLRTRDLSATGDAGLSKKQRLTGARVYFGQIKKTLCWEQGSKVSQIILIGILEHKLLATADL